MEPETAPAKFEDLNALSLSTIRRTVTWIEKHPVTATLVVPLVFSLIHGIGFFVISAHFGARGVPIEKIGFGAQTFEVGIMPILIVATIGFFLGCCLVISKELPPATRNFLQSIRDRSIFSWRSRGINRIKALFVDLNTRKGWLRFFDKYLRAIALIPLSAYLLIIFSSQVPRIFQTLFPGITIDIPDTTLSIWILTGISIFLFWLGLPTEKTNQQTPPERNIPESVERNLKVATIAMSLYGIFMMAMLLLLVFIIYAGILYPNMLRELGGGLSSTVTMHIKNELCKELEFPCPASDSHLETSAIKVRLVFEDENEYRVSIIGSANPSVIHTVNKQNVALVSISPPGQKP